MPSIPYESPFVASPEFGRLTEGLSAPGITALFGMPPAGRMATVALLARRMSRPVCLVCAGEAEATRAAADLNTLGLNAAVFPARDLLLRPIEGAGREYEYRRLAVLGGIVGGRINAVCVPAEGLLQYTVPRAEFCANTLTLKPGLEIPQKQLIARLFAAGYTRRDRVDGPGQFSVRGGILDLYPPDMEAPARLEYWGDEIDTLNQFDLLTQRRGDRLEKVYLSPAREVLFGDAAATAAALRDWVGGFRGKKKTALLDAMAPELDQLDSGLVPENLDKYLPVRYPRPATLLDYFDDPLVVLEEPARIDEAQRATRFRRQEELKGLLNEGVLAAGLDDYYLDTDWLYAEAAKRRTLACDTFARALVGIRLRALVDTPCHTLPSWGGDVPSLLEDLQPLLDKGYSVVITAGTDRAAKALAKDLAHRGLRATSDPEVLPAPGIVYALPGHLTGGVQFPFAKFALITGRRQGTSGDKAKQRAKRNKDALSSLSDIQPGDYVVHQNHGIGLYAGIQRMEIQGVEKDYLKIQYDKGDQLFVPVTQLDLLSRYTAPGDDDGKVKLSKLGGEMWTRTRSRVKKATEEIAQELVQLYARRKQARGFAFPEDGDWQRDFETRFDYDETDDQLTAAHEIKQDMEQPCPMDRLLCGDVGVGKTEVALRAAFKAVMGGKQVAILAPTTLLAWQHYNTALARMEPFNFRIGLLSRFRTAKQQKGDLEALKRGSIDVLVGTHRILSDDVKFKDLGLVIIDEEQRFGVKHKEKLKEAFVGVDMLTLSATPIPRTLNMAMSGIRDMSTIEEPPFERQPIETYVLEYDEGIVGEAIRKELARGGQVYYLHNQIGTLDQAVARVARMAPEARIGTAHGKMGEEALSRVWQQLLDNEIDVLVCTTLIETGVDVRNCNTLIIEDSDRMGLAQLYQIRGRVGRSGRKAYAYFTFRRDKTLSELANKRLSAIREFTSFGSGFRIAMRDLQIRGAGNLLGQSQHGHMEAIGYDLYVKLLNQAIAAAKGEPVAPDKSDCLVDIAVDAYIPESFIPDASGRIEAYKRIAAIQTPEDAADVLDELIDRYGDVPRSVSGLVDVSLIRVTAARCRIEEIGQKGQKLLFYSERLMHMDLTRLFDELGDRIAVDMTARPCLVLKMRAGEKPLDLLRMSLELMDSGAASQTP